MTSVHQDLCRWPGCSASEELGPQAGWTGAVCRLHEGVSKGGVSEPQPRLGLEGNECPEVKETRSQVQGYQVREAKTSFAGPESQSLENRNRRFY